MYYKLYIVFRAVTREFKFVIHFFGKQKFTRKVEKEKINKEKIQKTIFFVPDKKVLSNQQRMKIIN